jgi:methyl-accepting chemotaxis protein
VKLTITRKLILSSLVSLSFMLVVAGVGYWCVQRLSTGVTRILKETRVSDHSYHINSLSLEVRRFEKDMFLNCQDNNKRAEYEVKWRHQHALLEQELAALLDSFKIQQDRERVMAMQAGLKKYTMVMEDVIGKIKAGDLKTPAECNAALTPHKDHIRAIDDGSMELVSEARRRMHEVSGDLVSSVTTATVLIISVSAIMVIVSLIFSLVVSRRLTAPIRQMMAFLDVAERDGDLTKRVDIRSRDEIGDMGEWFNRFIAKVHDIVSNVKLTASEVAGASQQLAAAAEQLSSGAQEQASSLEETAASLEEVTSSVKQNSDNAQQANQLATASRGTAEKGGQIINGTIAAMGEINQSSRKITDIITTIDEIAFQTNLLALNAAVEAARAGEQGRGFAVVAAEVRNLAQRSATAAKEIKTLIQDSVKKVESGSALVTQSGQALEEIVASVRRVRDLVTEIASSSLEQSTGINQVNQAVAQMDTVVQQNSSQTEELSSTAQALADQAQALASIIGQFKVSIDQTAPAGKTFARPLPAVPRRTQTFASHSRHADHDRNGFVTKVESAGPVGTKGAPVSQDEVSTGDRQGGFEEF